MANLKQMIHELTEHASSKTAAEQKSVWQSPDGFDHLDIEIPGPPWKTFWGSFFEVGEAVAKLPVWASFPADELPSNLSMLLQFGTDDNAEVMWSDGGELTFYADANALIQGRFERIWGTCQGG